MAENLGCKINGHKNVVALENVQHAGRCLDCGQRMIEVRAPNTPPEYNLWTWEELETY